MVSAFNHTGGARLDIGFERDYFNFEMWIRLGAQSQSISVAALFYFLDPLDHGFEFRRIADYESYAPEARANREAGIIPDPTIVEMYVNVLMLFLKRHGERALTNNPSYLEKFWDSQERL
jgi:hypothetical protein